MKRLPMLVLLTAPYVLLLLYLSENGPLLPPAFAGVSAVLCFGAIYAFFLPRLGFQSKQLLFWCMVLKICNIPIFCLIFVVSCGLFVVILPVTHCCSALTASCSFPRPCMGSAACSNADGRIHYHPK